MKKFLLAISLFSVTVALTSCGASRNSGCPANSKSGVYRMAF